MNQEEQLFILDFDGVLADSYVAALIAARKVLPRLSEERFQESLTRGVVIPWYQHLVRQPISLLVQHFLAAELKKSQPFPETDHMLEQLAAVGRVTVVTSGRARSVEQFLHKHQLSQFVSDVWGGNGAISKRKGLQIMRQRYAAQDHRPVFFTDTVGDIHQGQSEGLTVVAVGWGYQSREVLQAGSPDYYLESPTEIKALIGQIAYRP